MNNVPPPKLGDLSQAQQERLFHIDFKLRFLGAVNRNDLVNRFGIKAAAATRDISLYKELAPKTTQKLRLTSKQINLNLCLTIKEVRLYLHCAMDWVMTMFQVTYL